MVLRNFIHYFEACARCANSQSTRQVITPPQYLLNALIIFCLLFSHPGAGASDKTEHKLKKITEKIQTLDKKSSKQQGALGKLESQIETLERKISSTAQSKSELQQKLSEQKKHINNIEEEYDKTKKSIGRHQRLLAGHLRAQHRLGFKPGYSVLNLTEPGHNSLNQAWFNYLQNARKDSLLELQTQSLELKTLEQKQQQAVNRLKNLKDDLDSHNDRLAKQKKQRTQTVSKLTRRLKTTQHELKQLKQNQAKLNKVLKELRKTLADPAFSVQGKVAFAKLRGKLPWPVKGKINKAKDSKGVRITTASGLSVRAISAGRIVYADWLRGFGLLTIIDHGEGYMSLYGNNESLYKQVGDWVDPGTVISTTGNSGGRQTSGLYFEIRHKSVRLSTKKWCKKTS